MNIQTRCWWKVKVFSPQNISGASQQNKVLNLCLIKESEDFLTSFEVGWDADEDQKPESLFLHTDGKNFPHCFDDQLKGNFPAGFDKLCWNIAESVFFLVKFLTFLQFMTLEIAVTNN